MTLILKILRVIDWKDNSRNAHGQVLQTDKAICSVIIFFRLWNVGNGKVIHALFPVSCNYFV